MSRNLRPGMLFADYRIERILGSGGMGAVYLARHPRLPRSDALKVMAEQHDAESRARFIREAELAARLDHPNIVTVYDRGVESDSLWLAMQFVKGIDASALLSAEGALPPERALHIVREAARGLDAAHRAGMLHRDVKPANILLEVRDDLPERVYVTDFGIAKAIGETTGLTETGTVLATLAYSAPEQISAQPLDARADVYALGCTLYELLTGEKPFPRGHPAQVMAAHLYEPPPRPSVVRPGLPVAIDAVIACALAKSPGDRFPSCGMLANAASAAFGGSEDRTLEFGEALPPPPGKSHRPNARRSRGRRAILFACAMVLVGAVIAGGVVGLGLDRSQTKASTAVPTTSLGPSWGNFAFIVDAFPRLLPADPRSSGYQGMLCTVVDKDKRTVSLSSQPEGAPQMDCNGNRNPAEWIAVTCNTNRTPTTMIEFTPKANQILIGDERFSRSGKSGRIVWADTQSPYGNKAGVLLLGFDDPTQNFCHMQIFGGTSGQDLYDRWWKDAPL